MGATRGTEVDEGCHGSRCDHLDELLEQSTRLRKEVARLRGVQQSEREIDTWYHTVAWADRQPWLGLQPGESDKQALG